MIATTSSGRRFAALARYLLYGRSGEEMERVAWTAGRNLGLDDPDLAAVLMQAVADQNPRVESPVYHLTLNFDPADPVTPERMQAVADRVLADLGLAEYQALMVAHQDRAHPHVHIMVNRVHPETGVAWDRWQDRPRIERTLRALERELGLRQVRGRLHQLEGQEAPERAQLTSGERRQAERTGDPAFPDRVRAHLPELRAARSWEELEAALARHGLRLKRKGQGLVITDGIHQVKASRVARDLSLRQLELRFGVAYPERAPRTQAVERVDEVPSPAVEQVRSALAEHERVAALRKERSGAEQEVAGARERLQRLDRAMERVRHASQRFDAALGRVYRDAAEARARFVRTSADIGTERAVALLQSEPERFGALKTVERRRPLGLGVSHDDRQARLAAPSAALRGRELTETQHALGALARGHVDRAGTQQERNGSEAERSAEAARREAESLVSRAAERLRRLQQQLKHAPSLSLLERSIGRAVDRLLPRELAQLRRVLTAPHAVIAFKAREAVKDILLGREEGEE
jgi:hypothetical protein